MSKIKVPDGMSRAAIRAASQAWDAGDLKIVYPPYPNEPFYNHSTVILEAALLWLSENPIAPTDKQFFDLSSDVGDVRMRCVEWQRRMFLAPEPEIPEAIAYLWWSECETQRTPDENSVSVHARKLHNRQLIEAFRAGEKAGSK